MIIAYCGTYLQELFVNAFGSVVSGLMVVNLVLIVVFGILHTKGRLTKSKNYQLIADFAICLVALVFLNAFLIRALTGPYTVSKSEVNRAYVANKESIDRIYQPMLFDGDTVFRATITCDGFINLEMSHQGKRVSIIQSNRASLLKSLPFPERKIRVDSILALMYKADVKEVAFENQKVTMMLLRYFPDGVGTVTFPQGNDPGNAMDAKLVIGVGKGGY